MSCWINIGRLLLFWLLASDEFFHPRTDLLDTRLFGRLSRAPIEVIFHDLLEQLLKFFRLFLKRFEHFYLLTWQSRVPNEEFLRLRRRSSRYARILGTAGSPCREAG